MTDRYSTVPRTMCLVFYEDELLMIKGGESKPWVGIYNPIGGHIEAGEEILESALREIEEESGLTPIDTRLAGVVHATNFYGVNVMMFVTVSKVKTREVVGTEEGELEWVKVEDLDKIKTFADVRPIVEKAIGNNEKVFSGTVEFDGQGEVLELEL